MQKLKSWFTSLTQPSISASYSQNASNDPLPELIQQLTKEHSQLISSFADVIKLSENQRFDKAIEGLTAFRSALTEHLIKENSQLYLELNTEYRNDPIEFQLISGLRKDMTEFAKTFLVFIQTWRVQGINPGSLKRFLLQAKALNDVLIKRLQEEERDLFPLYYTPPELAVTS